MESMFRICNLGIDAAFAMTLEELMKIMIEVYCLRNEIQKMENELWNLTVKGNDVFAGTTRLQDTIQMANSLMDQKVRAIATKDAENKRKWEDEQEVVRVYVAGNKKGYVGTLPLCDKCKLYHHHGKGHTKRYCPGSENQNGDKKARQNLDIFTVTLPQLSQSLSAWYKAHLVANGRSQQFGVDCDDTFSHIVKLTTIRTVLSLVLSWNWHVHQVVVKNAFLNGDLFEIVYMYQPLGYENRVGFSSSHCDSSFFIYQHGSEVAYLLIYVDDIVLTTSSMDLLQRIISSLHKEFDMTDLGALNYFLGIFVTRDSTGMFLSQKEYALKLLDRAHMANCNPTRTPVDTESKLGSDKDPISDPTLYRSLASGSLAAYIDADWAGYPTTRRSTSAEYKGVANVVAETAWLRNLLKELHTPLLSGTLVYCDNVGAIYMTANPVQHQRTKHIEIDIHFVRDMVARGQVHVLHVPFRYQYADIFTKGRPLHFLRNFVPV
ncbi:ribonuclease H-like domain-containing protein [Tanacetum coccineum]